MTLLLMLHLLILGNVPAAPPADSFSTSSLLAILGAIGTLVSGIGAVLYGKAQKNQGQEEQKKKQVEVSNNPLAVKMEDHFVTRREFDNFRSEVRIDVTEIKGLFGRLTDKFDERDKRYQDKLEDRDLKLSAKIEAVASGAYEARRRIHEKVNDQGERIKSLEDRTPLPPKRNGGQ
jgi:hypothetical protein